MRRAFYFQWMFLLLPVMMTCRHGNQITDPDGNAGPGPNVTIETISAEEAGNLIDDNRDNPDFHMIDVRTPREYSLGHISGSVNIDFTDPSFEDRIGELDRSGIYLIYCASGNRSSQALAVMEKLDFVTVYNLDGGIAAWTRAGYSFVT